MIENRKRIRKGSSNFKRIIEDNGYFVDKTMLIKEFFEDNSYTLLIPRPKRFGKTLNLSMIEHFFDIQKTESAKLFSEFKIAQDIDFCKQHQNQYPVINISLKSIKETSWEKCLNKFQGLISDLYQKYKFLLQSDKLEKEDKLFFERIISEKATEPKLKESLVKLSKFLHKHYSKEVIILVDEYDAPIISAFKYTKPPIKTFQNGDLTYYEKVINFMQGFLGEAYKGNEDSLKKGLLTGVMRVGKESIFSEWNNFEVYGITSKYYSDKFGFTKPEVENLLNYFGIEKDLNIITKWYDGYIFGDVNSIFNPWSIVSYISNRKDGFKPYWVNTGDYSLIKNRIIISGMNEPIKDLIEGKTIDKELKDNFVFQDFEANNELLWTLLTDNGYLTQVKKSKYGNYKLKIPNNEVRIVYKDIIRSWLDNEVKIKRDLLIETAENLINNKITDFEICFKQIIGDSLSYFDTSEKKSNDAVQYVPTEQIYHVYTLGLLTILSDDYIIKSNRESKHGRYDIMLIPHDKTKNGIVIEIKHIEYQKQKEKDKEFKERINYAIDKALDQIEKKEYYKELLVNKIEPKKIIKLAIVFAGKEPYINRLTE